MDGIWKALGKLLLCSGIGVTETNQDGRYDGTYCERYKQDEAFVIDRFYHCGPVVLKLNTGDRLQRESRSWLTPPDPSPNYNIACKIHQDGTATWFFQASIFAEWNTKGFLLWIHGKRASSILALLLATILISFPCCSGFRKNYSDVRGVSPPSIVDIHALFFRLF